MTTRFVPGDGFFVGRDVPYNYRPGPDGVEVLEFRTADGPLAGQVLPGYSAGFGWVVPALIGFVVGLLVHRLSGGRADDSPAGPAPTLA